MAAETPPEAGLFRKIAEVMGEVGYLQKRGVNNFQNYKYATEADIVEAVREKLAERHVALIPGVPSITERPYTTSKGKDSVVTTAQMTFTFCDGDTGAMFRTEWAGQGDDPADKGLYSAMTGALKYFLMKTFLIPTGNDPEANEQTDKRAADRTNGAPVGDVFIGTEAHAELVKGFEFSGVTPADLKMKLAAIGAQAAQAKQGVKAALACVTVEQAKALTDWFSAKADEQTTEVAS